MNKIGLNMIAKGKDEEVQLKDALDSVAPFVDGIFITLTSPKSELKEAEKVIKSFERPDCPVHLSYGEFIWYADQQAYDWLKKFLGYEPHMKVGDKLFEFDKARNFNLEQVTKDYPWIFWMDSDDILRNGQNLHRLTDVADRQNIEAIYFNYIYQAEFGLDGEIKHKIIEHIRERLIRNNGHFKWIAPIHETLIEQVPTQKTDTLDCDVVHKANMASRMDSLTRNMRNLELAIYRTEGKDPRHLYYLAKAYFDLRKPEYDDRVIPLINSYLVGENKSGWPEERAQAWEYLSEIYRRKGDHIHALGSCLSAFAEPCQPSFSVYLNIALCWVMLQNWDLAMYWVKLASTVPELSQSTLIKNTKDMQGRMLEVMYNATLNMGQIDQAWAAATKMLELFPDEQSVKNAHKLASELRTQRDLVMNVKGVADFLVRSGEGAKIKPLLAATPRFIEQTPYIQQMFIKNNPPKPWGSDEIAIYCGPQFTEWTSKSLDNPQDSFIGGSEEAVIHMSRELALLGWRVTVYGAPGNDEGEIDGVTWLNYYKFNPLDNFNIVISWRQIGFFDQKIKAKKTYLWLHDIVNPMEYTKERTDRITKIIPLSKWHRDLMDNVPDDKFMISSNGI